MAKTKPVANSITPIVTRLPKIYKGESSKFLFFPNGCIGGRGEKCFAPTLRLWMKTLQRAIAYQL
jgi:hypothetical protein